MKEGLMGGYKERPKAEQIPQFIEATERDIEDIVSMWNSVVIDNVTKEESHQLEKEGFFIRELSLDTLLNILNTPRSIVILDRREGKVDAFAISLSMKEWMNLMPDYKESLCLDEGEKEILEKEDVLFIYSVMSTNPHITKAMYKELFGKARQKDYKLATGQIVLEPIPNNRSIRFHCGALGFEQIGTRNDRKGETDITWGFYKRPIILEEEKSIHEG